MIHFRHIGDFKKTLQFLERAKNRDYSKILDKYGEVGVRALASATPKRTGTTASSWSYKITSNSNEVKITWLNSNTNKGVNIAIILQYGHGTGRGGYVRGIDYINPALRPVFDQIADAAWKEVTKA